MSCRTCDGLGCSWCAPTLLPYTAPRRTADQLAEIDRQEDEADAEIEAQLTEDERRLIDRVVAEVVLKKIRFGLVRP